MTDYISRKAAIALADHFRVFGKTGFVVPVDALKKLTAADVKPVVHGHWEDRGSLSARCSECGCKSLRASDYCPACGADMRPEGGAIT